MSAKPTDAPDGTLDVATALVQIIRRGLTLIAFPAFVFPAGSVHSKPMFRRLAHTAFFLCLLAAGSSESAAQPSVANLPDPAVPLFASDAPLEIEIAADLRAVLRDRGEDAEYHEATITHIADG